MPLFAEKILRDKGMEMKEIYRDHQVVVVVKP